MDKGGAKRDAEAETGEYVGGVVPEQELHQHGCAAEEPDVDP